MHPVLAKYGHCLRLNLRVGALALRNRWLRTPQFAAGYDRVAESYDRQWLAQLRPVTDALLSRLPENLPPGDLLDLGCGTGYTTAELLRRHPNRLVTGLDISAGMLAAARRRVGAASGIAWVQEDMLAFLRRRAAGQAALAFSTWAIGYSHHRQVLREAGRALAPGGVLAFIVNYADTLQPVFRAFHRCLARHPDQVRLALWPDFPPDWESLRASLAAAEVEIRFNEDGTHPVAPPAGVSCFDWLLTTGVLAGFDAVLPLRAPGPVAAFMRTELEALTGPLAHHYAAVLAVKKLPGATA